MFWLNWIIVLSAWVNETDNTMKISLNVVVVFVIPF